MKKMSVKDLVNFRRKTDRGKKTFVEKIKSNKVEPPSEGGGDYWVSSLSAICRSYKDLDLSIIDDKIDDLQEKNAGTKRHNTKSMYQRNIEMLDGYKSMDLKEIRPSGKLAFLKKSTANHLLTIKGFQIKVEPSHIYIFGKKEEEEVGAIWFVIKKGGFHINEAGMFCDMLYRFLKHNYSKKYQLSPKNCIAVDIFNKQIVNYTEITSGAISPILNKTLEEINKFL